MKGTGAGGLLLLLIGALGLIGFLTGNLDRWLGYLFSPGTPIATSGTPAGASPPSTTTAVVSRTANQRNIA